MCTPTAQPEFAIRFKLINGQRVNVEDENGAAENNGSGARVDGRPQMDEILVGFEAARRWDVIWIDVKPGTPAVV